MKPIRIIFFVTAVLFLWACVPKMAPVRLDLADALFSRAEKMLQAESYPEALDAYGEYLERFPDRPLADAALMKLGSVYAILGDNEKARSAYERLIAEYPESIFVPDAGIEMLTTYYNQGYYEDVITEAADLIEVFVSGVHLLRVYVLLGDTYMAIGAPKDAVYYYILAVSQAGEPEKETILITLKDALQHLGSEDLVDLTDPLKDDVPKGYLMFQLGLNYTEEEKYNEALKVLSAFIEKFPVHENVQQAKSLLASIHKKSVYSRYTIGCLLPLSGPYKIYGNRALTAVELALNQFSANNSGPSIKVIIKDTASDPAKAAMAVKELYDENVAAIIGPFITAESAATAAQNKGIPIITLTQKDNITRIGDYVFRNFFTPGKQVETLVSFVVDALGVKKFAILYPDEKYGTTFMNLFWDQVIAHGGSVVGVESYNPTHTDFADPIKKLVGLYYKVPEDLKIPDLAADEQESNESVTDSTTDPLMASPGEDDENIETEENEKPEAIVDFDAIFIPDAPTKAGLVIPQLAFYDVTDTYLLGTNLWHSDRLITMARQYVQGAVVPDGFFAEDASENVKNFVGIYQKVFDQKPGFIEAVTYDTAMILFQMVSRPDIRFRSTLKNELERLTDFQGVTGLTSFDNEGDVRKRLYLLQIKGNRFFQLEHRSLK
ncbi:MAG: penicillin-binding protein activator [Deltaproteobacteria bacterium]|nr:penicillin-binding protein activator [Deltaproteobacteria bacterium]